MLEGDSYIHMLSDSCFTSAKAHIIALRCHTGIHNKQLEKESSERFACRGGWKLVISGTRVVAIIPA